MSTQTFPITDGRIRLSGQWLDGLGGGHNYRNCRGAHSQIETVVVGTQLRIQINCGTSPTLSASVDGGAFSALPNTGGAWGYVTVFTGLTDAVHTVILKHTAGNQNDLYFDRDVALEVTGAAPDLQAPSGYGTEYLLNDPAYSPYIAREGGFQSESAGGYTNPQLITSVWPDAALRFRAACQTIRVWTYQNGQKLLVLVNGVEQGIVTAATVNRYDWLTLATGLDANAAAEYTLSVAYTTGSAKVYIYSLMLAGGSGLISVTPAARSSLAFYGDSIARADHFSPNDSTKGVAYRLARQRGQAVLNRGVAGSTVKQFGSGGPPVTTQAGEARTADVTALNPAPTYLIVLYGTNDMAQAGGTETPAQLQVAYQNMLGALKTGLSGTQILCLGILDRSGYDAAARAPWSAAIRAAVESAASRSIRFVDVEGWIDQATDTVDGVHPNAGGYERILARLRPLLIIEEGAAYRALFARSRRRARPRR